MEHIYINWRRLVDNTISGRINQVFSKLFSKGFQDTSSPKGFRLPGSFYHLIYIFTVEIIHFHTGGQASKATKTGAVAQFAAGGKETKKKDLAGIAMSYGYVYVAQISMGADYAQTVKAIAEAEAYPGPSLVIAYAPCINHGIKKGMDKAQTEEKLAVECGYWHNFRYNPAAEDKKFTLDSKAPTGDYQAFLKGEVRYASLALKNPDRAGALDAKNEEEAKARYQYLNKLVTLYTNN